MDWTGKMATFFEGIFSVVGLWALRKAGKEVDKKIKPTWKAVKEFTKHTGKIADLEQRANENKRKIFIADATMDAVYKLLPFAVYKLDAKGNMVFGNSIYTEITGLSIEDAAGKGYLRAVSKDDKVLIEEQSKLREKAPFVVTGYINFDNVITGKATRCRYRTEIIKGPEGQVEFYLGLCEIIK